MDLVFIYWILSAFITIMAYGMYLDKLPAEDDEGSWAVGTALIIFSPIAVWIPIGKFLGHYVPIWITTAISLTFWFFTKVPNAVGEGFRILTR